MLSLRVVCVLAFTGMVGCQSHQGAPSSGLGDPWPAPANRPVRPFVPLIGAVFAALAIMGTLMYAFPIEREYAMFMKGSSEQSNGFAFNLYEAAAYSYVLLVTFTTLGLVMLHYGLEIVAARKEPTIAPATQ